jgi:chloride channel 2
LINNYWRAFFTCAVGAVAIKVALSQERFKLLEDFRTNLPAIDDMLSVKLIAFILIGCACGLLSSLFIWLFQKVVAWKKKHGPILSKVTPFGEVTIVAFFTALISFPLLYLRLDHASAVHSLFTNDNIDEWYSQTLHTYPNATTYNEADSSAGVRGAIILSTLVYTVVKLGLTVVSITLPIPYGIYIPLFAIGAAFGRACGELFALIAPEQGILPRGFAAIGAAALCGGATRTISSAVIILELTNDMNYFIPILLAVTLSTGIGNMLNHSIYDVFLRNKGLPYLPFLRVKGDSIVAHDIMNRELFFVTQKSTIEEMQKVLDSTAEHIIPIIDSPDSLHMVGVISRKTLVRVITYQQKLHSASLGEGGADVEMLEMEKENATLLEEMEKNSETYIPSPVSSPGLLPPPSPPTLDSTSIDGRIDLLELSLRNPWVMIDMAPFQVVENTPIRKILFMFSMLGGHVLFVTYRGKLVGMISKQSLVLRLCPPVPH